MHNRTLYVLLSLVAAILFIAAALMFRETRSLETARRARDSHPLRTYAALLRNRQLLGFLLTASFNAASLFTYLGSAPLVLMKNYGVRAPVFSLIMAANSIGLIAASQVNRYLLVTRTPQQVLRGSARNALVLSVAFALFSVTLGGGMPVMLALIFVVLASLSIIQANTTACALSIDPHSAGAIAALLGALAFGMGTAMSYLAGLLYDGTPRPMMITIALNLVGTAAALRLLALRRDH